MYISYIQNRRELGYQVLIDINCGIKLVSITDSTTRKIKRIFIGSGLALTIWVISSQPAQAVGLSMPMVK